MNLWIADGVVSREPEKRQAGNSTVLTLNLCVSEKWKDKSSGEDKERRMYIDAKLWGGLGDATYQQVVQGDRVLVRGKLETESWDDKKSGEKRYKTVCKVEDITILTVLTARVPQGPPEPAETAYLGDEAGGSDVPF